MRSVALWMRVGVAMALAGSLAIGAALAEPPKPDAFLEPTPEHLAGLLEVQARSEKDAEASLFALQMKMYGLFAAAPSGSVVTDYVMDQWSALAELPDADVRARGATLIAEACEAAYMRTLNLESNLPPELCAWTRDETRRDALVNEGRVVS